MLKTDLMGFVRYLIVVFLIAFSPSAFSAGGDRADAEYKAAADCYHAAKKLPKGEQTRPKWYKCASGFDQFYRRHPKSERAPQAAYSAGISYKYIYEITANPEDAKDAISRFKKVAASYKESSLADDALLNAGRLEMEALNDTKTAKETFLRIISWYPDGDMAAEARKYLSKMEGGSKVVKEVRPVSRRSKYVRLAKIERISNGDGEKVVLKLSGPVNYRTSGGAYYDVPGHKLFTVELDGVYLSRLLDTGYSYVGKSIVRDIIPQQASKEKAEINLVIKEKSWCEVVKKTPDLEIQCRAGTKPTKKAVVKQEPEKHNVVEQLADSIPYEKKTEGKKITVVIDAGHGGKDFGAQGQGGTKEKDVTLQIAKRLGWYLRNKVGYSVEYTRIDDQFISLEARNEIAKGYNADVFVSIHTNASENHALDGYQTFYLNNATDEASRKLAQRENASAGKNLDDLEKIILTMMQNINTDESRLLADTIHKSVLSKMSSYGLKDRGVKSALFYVLVGARSPAVLIETSFISNTVEEERLKNPNYQEDMARAIAEGIRNYVNSRPN